MCIGNKATRGCDRGSGESEANGQRGGSHSVGRWSTMLTLRAGCRSVVLTLHVGHRCYTLALHAWPPPWRACHQAWPLHSPLASTFAITEGRSGGWCAVREEERGLGTDAGESNLERTKIFRSKTYLHRPLYLTDVFKLNSTGFWVPMNLNYIHQFN
jgi:hypothetical protein